MPAYSQARILESRGRRQNFERLLRKETDVLPVVQPEVPPIRRLWRRRWQDFCGQENARTPLAHLLNFGQRVGQVFENLNRGQGGIRRKIFKRRFAILGEEVLAVNVAPMKTKSAVAHQPDEKAVAGSVVTIERVRTRIAGQKIRQEFRCSQIA